ncbi:Bifunctional protein Aas [Symmachiella dynata]|uniref:acyl-[ACP]--phospholipid O-acyltransferase n=1 Tax=Symmachiella dynata TaxID=2527995 RepID=UPI00118D1F73|nr:acyl-[ACP]--phospholipid O-acyltransferase [Symmachiella dynata]QDT48716.1 Bifunctional protein Aas [Symmachiella dynata]
MSQNGQPSASVPYNGLSSRSFVALLVTQFLGAINDNMFRWLVVPIAKVKFEEEGLDANLALSIGLFCFTLPYLLFVPYAGYFADKFSKRTVIVGCKVAEVVIMLVGIAAISIGNTYGLFAVVAMMGAQSALYGPARFGSIPELLRTEDLSTGNGWMGLVTVVSSALGFVGGLLLFGATKPYGTDHLWISTVVLLGVAAVGLMASLMIRRVPAADASKPFPHNPVLDTGRNLQLLWNHKSLLRATLGIAFFWFLASLANINIDPYGTQDLRLPQEEIWPLLVVLVAGVGFGSVLAGIWSGGKVELGIVPLGAVGIVLSSFLLYRAGSAADFPAGDVAQRAMIESCVWLFFLGISAGLFNIPLEAFLQHRSSSENRGTILAAANFVTFAGMLLVSLLFPVMQGQLNMSASQVFLASGIGTIPVLIYIFTLLPGATIRFMFWLLTRTVYRVRLNGQHNLPETGGALIVANHVSWVDGLLILTSSSRLIRFLVYADYTKNPGLNWLTRTMKAIPIKGDGGPKAMVRALQVAKEAVENGELVCIFAEGQITRTGQLQPFQRGLMRIVAGTDAPIIPVYLDELWGSIFSYSGGKLFWKWPRHWPYLISIHFGKPIQKPENVSQVRQAVQQLGVHAMEQRKGRQMVLPRQFLRNCRKGMFRLKISDSTGQECTGGQTILRSLVLKRLLDREVLSPDEKMVGVLIPPSVGATLVNAALSISRRVPVNLNYTVSSEIMNSCIRQCGIKHVLTSRKVMEKLDLELDAEVVYLDDLKDKVTTADKLISAAQTYLLPAAILERILGLTKIKSDDLLTIIFTSGSTGDPKGVMLTQHNISTNVEAVDQVFRFTNKDTILGILPFFHSFGFTGNLWLTLTRSMAITYHVSPLDARVIGKLAQKYKATVLISTPTFLRTYLKRCTPENFATIDLVICGAEKMPLDVAQAFEDKFGARPIEGYGTTELSPVVAANIPSHRSAMTNHAGVKEGTVGHPVPGVAAKIVDPETGEDLGIDTPGMLLISGPNVMKGYLNRPEQTAEVIRDGWYVTGDIAKIDSDGFIQITDRLSRFSKIAGEMVPHLQIENALQDFLSQTDTEEDDMQVKAVVTAVPDERKGERLVVVHLPLSQSADEICRQLKAAGLPNLFIPSTDSFVEVQEIPVLGTGKLDLKGLKQVAIDHFAPSATS